MKDLSPQFILFIYLILAASGLTLIRLRRMAGTEWLRWNRVQPLPLNFFEVLVIIVGPFFLVSLLMGLMSPFGLAGKLPYFLLPFFALAFARMYLDRYKIDSAERWNLSASACRSRLTVIFAATLASIFPIAVCAVFSSWICGYFGITELEQKTVQLISESSDPAELAFLLVCAVIIAPIAEEILFRGVLYPWLKKFGSQKWALLGNALIFSAFHFHLPSFLPLAMLGLLLALVYEYSGSLAACITFHALFNFATCANLMLARFY